MHDHPLVDAAWLGAHLDAPDLLILDASLYLPHEGQDAQALYRQAHLPGALFFDIDAFSDPDTDLPHMVPSAGRFARLAGAMGITPQSRVVVYDQRGLFSAARAWWLLRLFGHTRVSVLDGGLPAWQAGGLPVESGHVIPQAQLPLPVRFDTKLLCGLADVQRELAADRLCLLDARAAARFTGSAPEPRPGVAAGHIPGSRNLPYAQLLGEDGRLLPKERLRQLLHAHGVDGSRTVAASCGSGVTAAIVLLALTVADVGEGALYDGSWAEWGSHPATLKVTGTS